MEGQRRATDDRTVERLFGSTDLLPMWIAEPYLPPPAAVQEALAGRAGADWFGYEIRPNDLRTAFWQWMSERHGWDGDDTLTSYSPSIGTSLATVIELTTSKGDGVLLQPPVFTDFKPIVRRSKREPVTNPLVLDDGHYSMDLDHLESVSSDPSVKLMILCNPHNPVGRTWTTDELAAVAEICARNDVVVFADEVHGDLALFDGRFVPFGFVAGRTAVRWIAATGPIKTFGLAGVCDTLVVSSDEALTRQFRSFSERFHLVRSNVFGLAASVAGYQHGGPWLSSFVATIERNVSVLAESLPGPIRLVRPQATYLAWLDLRDLGLDVPELNTWLAHEARLALSPGHWFGREGAGFARMTVACDEGTVRDAAARLTSAIQSM